MAGLRLDCRVLSRDEVRRECSLLTTKTVPGESRAQPRSLAVGGTGGLDAGRGLPVRLGGLSVQRAAGARQELARFADLQAVAPPQVAAPDVSDWDLERIAEWRLSLEQVAPPPLAVLRIPKIKLEVAVLPGTEEFVLNRGVGHIPGTSLPGTDGNSAIAGHRDGFFRGLKDVVAGDAIEIETLGAREVYFIERMWVVEPEDVYVLEPTPVRSITLVTCYPFYYAGSAPHRYIVRAVLAADGVAPTAASRTPEWSMRAPRWRLKLFYGSPTSQPVRGGSQTSGFEEAGMKRVVVQRVLVGLLICLAAVGAMAQTEKTTTLSGTVEGVDGGTLVVKMDNGELRMFTPPADRVFMVDGKELKLADLKPGTKLTATVKETATTTMATTVESLEGTVAYASGPTVILTLPSKERKLYNIKSTDPVKFYNHEGKEITVFDLRKNMQIKATKLTEAPRTELVANVAVTGTAPAAGAGTTQAAAKPAAAAPAAPAAAQSQPASTQASAATPATLPKTGSQLPLLGLIGLASLVIALGLGVARRR